MGKYSTLEVIEMRYTFIQQYEADYSSKAMKVTLETDSELVSEVISDFEQFLRGCGYCFKGRLEIVNEEE